MLEPLWRAISDVTAIVLVPLSIYHHQNCYTTADCRGHNFTRTLLSLILNRIAII